MGVLLATYFICLTLGLLFYIVCRCVHKINESFSSTMEHDYSNVDLLIVTAHFNEDLAWLTKAPYPVVMCDKPGAAHSPFTPSFCIVEKNLGREASAFLRFIVMFYDKLPEHVAFIHGHERAWHQDFDIINEIKCANFKDYDFIKLSRIFPDDWKDDHNDTQKRIFDIIAFYWKDYFEPYLQRQAPKMLMHACCAQFIVSRKAILRHPKEAYEKWYGLSLTTQYDTWDVGVMFEFIWHIIFGDSDVVKKEEHDVRFYSSCRQ